jgi:NitT/TauT family transport system substrate-binding protein
MRGKGEPDVMSITLIENFRAVFYTPFYAAFALGAYESEGLDVQRVMSSQPAETMRMLLNGKGDVAWGGPIRLLAAHNESSDCHLVIFCEAVGRDPFFLVGREPCATFRFENLLDKRLATVSEVPTPWLCLQHDLRLAGYDPAQVRRISGRSMPENVEALQAGEVDVIQVFQPYVEDALAADAGHIWYAAADRGLTAYTSLYTTREHVARNPESLLCMTRAMYRTQSWIANHDATTLAACVADFFPDLPRQVLTQALRRYQALGLWNLNPMLVAEGFEWLVAACLSGGFIQQSVSYERCVDMQFAKQVIQEAPPAL